MSVAIVTGSAGLIGSEAVRYFAEKGMRVVGVDNDMRRTFFGDEASTLWNQARLKSDMGERYRHESVDIRDDAAIDRLFVSLRRGSRAGDSHRRAAVARLGGSRSENRFLGQRAGHA